MARPYSVKRYSKRFKYVPPRRRPASDHDSKPVSMSADEIRAQIAVGALTDHKAIAEIVRVCDTPEVVIWASRHDRASVRAAAAKKKELPFTISLRLMFLDKAKTVKAAAAYALSKYHSAELKHLLDNIESFPQLPLPFTDQLKVPNSSENESISDSVDEIVEIVKQMPKISGAAKDDLDEDTEDVELTDHEDILDSAPALTDI